jgi:plastocyanin
VVLKRAAQVMLVLAAMAPVKAAHAGSIAGHVDVRRAASRAPEPRPATAELGAQVPPDLPDRRRSVVYLQTAPQGAFEVSENARARLDQKNQAFEPYVLAIRTGTTVDFPNNDRTYHNVFSLSKAARFDLGRYSRGRSKSVRFDRPGVVRVFCDIHSHMSAFILVFAHRYFATTDTDGAYRIEGVPPGTYMVAVWNDGEEREARPVTIPPEGGQVQLDLVVR